MSKSSYYALKAMKRCVVCGKNKADEGYTTCLVCRMDQREKGDTRSRDAVERHNEYLKKRRQDAKANGICYMCNKRPAKKKSTLCEYCLARGRINAEKQRRKKEITPRTIMDGEHVCKRCGALKEENGHRVCDECYQILREAMLHARSFRDPINKPNYFERSKELMFVDAKTIIAVIPS